MKTHQVLDTILHEDEGQGCFVGTLEECNNFVSEQQSYGLVVVPLLEWEYKLENNIK